MPPWAAVVSRGILRSTSSELLPLGSSRIRLPYASFCSLTPCTPCSPAAESFLLAAVGAGLPSLSSEPRWHRDGHLVGNLGVEVDVGVRRTDADQKSVTGAPVDTAEPVP